MSGTSSATTDSDSAWISSSVIGTFLELEVDVQHQRQEGEEP
jgi:hypothetical protein